MPQFDFGHFYKFIVSAGLVLVGAAFVVPWIVFQSTGILTISKTELDGLTDTAKTLIIERQSGLSDFQDWAFPGLPLALAIIGVCVTALGLILWHKRQATQNALEDLDLESKLAALSDATPSEVDAKLREEVAEDLGADPVEEPSAASGAEPGNDQGAPDASSTHAVLGGSSVVASRMGRIRDWEASLFARLEQAYTGATKPRQNVRMTTLDGRMYILDALLSPAEEDSEWGQLAIELKAVTSGKNLVPRIRGTAVQLGAVALNLTPGLVYTGMRGRPPKTTTTAVAIFVCDSATLANEHLRVIAERTVRELHSLMQVSVGVIVISEDSFANSDALTMRSLITQAWANRGEDGQLVWSP